MSTTVCAVRCSIPLLVANVATNVWFADMTYLQMLIQGALFVGGAIIVAHTARRNYIRALERYLRANQDRAQSRQG